MYKFFFKIYFVTEFENNVKLCYKTEFQIEV